MNNDTWENDVWCCGGEYCDLDCDKETIGRIRTLIATTRKEVVEECERALPKNDTIKPYSSEQRYWQIGYNECSDEAFAALRVIKEKV